MGTVMKKLILLIILIYTPYILYSQSVVFLHHSTGGNVFAEGKVQNWFTNYNQTNGKSYQITERAYPDSVAACVDSLHDALEAADASPRNSEPVLRLSRMAADLDFQRRTLPDEAEIGATCEIVQQELERVDKDLAERYFAGAARERRTTVV